MAESKNPLNTHWSEGIDDPHFIKVVTDCWKLYKSKGMDYTQGQWAKDRLANFHDAAEDAGTSVLQAWSILVSKHLHAVRRFVKEGKVESEPIAGRVHDVINYMILLLLIAQEQQGLSFDPIDNPRKVEHFPPPWPRDPRFGT